MNDEQEGKSMTKALLIGLAVGGLAFVPAQRFDAQISSGLPGVGGISFGFPGGFYAYPTAYDYYRMGTTYDCITATLSRIRTVTGRFILPIQRAPNLSPPPSLSSLPLLTSCRN
jgi:hypothetical protein